jgi:cardiolipin synthase
MNLPNALTVSRFFLVPIFVVCFFTIHQAAAFLIVLVAALTDVLDGYIARKYGQMSEIGAMLDPLADKTLMIAMTVVLVLDGRMDWRIGLLIGLREIIMIAVALVGRARGIQPVAANQLGKWTTLLYYVLFSALILGVLERVWADLLLVLILIFSVTASVYYARLMFGKQTKRHIRN